MAQLHVRTGDGATHDIDIRPGLSVMETIRDAGIDELLALCGGCCSCATCHVYVEDGAALFDTMGKNEHDLLDASEHRQPNSRLSCQLNLNATMSAVTVAIAPED